MEPITANSLTPRDLQILKMLGDGKSTKEIAFALGLSPKTVDAGIDDSNNPRCIAVKLGLRGKGRPSLVRYAVEHKLVTPEDTPKPVLDAITVTGMDTMQQAICRFATKASNNTADPIQCSCICQAAESFVKIERLRLALKLASAP